MTHRCVRAFLSDKDFGTAVHEEDVVALCGSLNFDITIYEVFVALVRGATLLVVERDIIIEPAQLGAVFVQRHITIACLSTSVFNALAFHAPRAFARVRLLQCAGEPANLDAIRSVLTAKLPTQLYNSCGPTETTVTVAAFRCDESWTNANVPIGRPLAGAFLYVVDPITGFLCPPGVRGELIVGGPQVSRGYLNRVALTNQRFVPDEYITQCGIPSLVTRAKQEEWRMYRSGDIAYYVAEGGSSSSDGGFSLQVCLEGRIDRQIKLNSTRIELGEVETTLRQHAQVRDAIVVKSETRTGGILVAYVVHDGDLESIRAYLKERLPPYSVPFLMSLDALPRNTSDKIDKSRLPLPHAAEAPQVCVPQEVRDTRGIRDVVVAVWLELLGLPREMLAEDVSFFDLGGDSLKIGLMAAKLRSYAFGAKLAVGILFKHVTINALVAYLSRTHDFAPAQPISRPQHSLDIVITGCALRLPGCDDLSQMMATFEGARDCILDLSEEAVREAGMEAMMGLDTFVRRKGVVTQAEFFDRQYFEMSELDAAMLDPQQRWLLTLSIEALERSCIVPAQIHGDVGVFFSVSESGYNPRNVASKLNIVRVAERLGRMPEAALGRLSYLLDIRGPVAMIGGACASGILAIGAAMHSLRAGQCSVAIVGTSCLDFPLYTGYVSGGIASRDGKCRAFDARASGTVPSQGAVVIVLTTDARAKEDKLPLLATVRATVVNNDGAQKMSFTASNAAQLENGMCEILHSSVGQLRYIEAHGSGTPLGDGTELTAIGNALLRLGFGPTACGSGKATFGHCGATSGLVGIARALCALSARAAPPTTHFETLNDSVPENVRHLLRPHGKGLVPWEATGKPDQVLVNASGQSGINSFALLEAPPPLEEADVAAGMSHWAVFPLSALTPAALTTHCARIAAWIRDHPEVDLRRLARTLQSGRRSQLCRTCVWGDSREGILQELEKKSRTITSSRVGKDPSVVLIFTGISLGALPTAIRRLVALSHRSAIVAQTIADCVKSGREAGLNVACWETDGAEVAVRTEAEKQFALFVIGVAEAQFYMHHGYSVDAVVGNSIGEVAAAVVAGAVTLSDACRIVAWQSMVCEKGQRGRTIAVRCATPHADLIDREDVGVAVTLSRGHVVFSGRDHAMRAFEADLRASGRSVELVDNHVAFHCRGTEPPPPLAHVEVAPARVAIFPTATCDTPFSAEYWEQQLSGTIQFQDALHHARARFGQSMVVIQCGVGNLSDVIQEEISSVPVLAPLATMADSTWWAEQRIADLFCSGVAPDWPKLHQLVPFLGDLPTYPFEFARCSPEKSTLSESPHKKFTDYLQERVFAEVDGAVSVGYVSLAPGSTGEKVMVRGSDVYPLGCLSRLLTMGLVGYVARRVDDTLEGILGRKIVDLVPPHVASTLPPSFSGMRLLHLVTSSSGLPFYPKTPPSGMKEATEFVVRLTAGQIFKELSETELRYAPGAGASYSVVGVGLLGLCLSAILHEPFEDLLHEFVQTVGMANTRTTSPYPEQWDCASGLRSAAGVFSTVEDLLELGASMLRVHGHPLATSEGSMLPFLFRGDCEGRRWYAGSTPISSAWFCVDLPRQCCVVLLAKVPLSPHEITRLGQQTLDWACQVAPTRSFVTPEIIGLWLDKVLRDVDILCQLKPNPIQQVAQSVGAPTPQKSQEAVAKSNRDVGECICRIVADLVADDMPITPATCFRDIGLDSLNALLFAVMVERELGVSISKNVLHEYETVGEMAAALQNTQGAPTSGSAKADKGVNMLLEEALRRVNAISTTPQVAREDGILLTGASGYLGVYILHSLVRLCERTVYCLALREQDLWNRINLVLGAPAAADILSAKRVKCFVGDVSKPKLGLAEHEWADLATNVSCIINAAGRHEWSLSLADTFEVNVGGAIRLVELASARSPPAVLYHVSTVGVLAQHKLSERNWPQDVADLSFGLVQGKAVAELALRKAQAYCPVTIFRPEPVYWIGGAEAADAGAPPKAWRFWERYVAGLAHLGLAPADGTCPGWTPIDFVASAIARIAVAPAPQADARILHITCPHPRLSMTSFMALLQSAGIALRAVPPEEFRKALETLQELHPTNPLAPLLEFYPPAVLSNNHDYPENDSAQFARTLRDLGVEATQLCARVEQCIPSLVRQQARIGALVRGIALPRISKSKSVRNATAEAILAPFFPTVVCTSDFPLVVCMGPVTPHGDMKTLMRQHGNRVREAVNAVGGVLLRNVGVQDTETMDAVAEALGSAHSYDGGIAPRTRATRALWTSTEAPRKIKIPLHCEMSYSPVRPQYIVFYCETPPAKGGQTPVADTRDVWSVLDAPTREHFQAHGLTYTIRAPPPQLSKQIPGLPWNIMFGTEDRAQVDATLEEQSRHARGSALQHEWLGDGTLRVQYTTSATWKDGAGRERWVNHAHIFHPSGHFELDVSVAAPSLVSEVYRRGQDRSTYPKFVTHGDGKELDEVSI